MSFSTREKDGCWWVRDELGTIQNYGDFDEEIKKLLDLQVVAKTKGWKNLEFAISSRYGDEEIVIRGRRPETQAETLQREIAEEAAEARQRRFDLNTLKILRAKYGDQS